MSKAFVSRLQKTKNGVTLSVFFFFWPPTSICTVYNHIHIIYIRIIYIYIYISRVVNTMKKQPPVVEGLRRPPYLVTKIDG